MFDGFKGLSVYKDKGKDGTYFRGVTITANNFPSNLHAVFWVSLTDVSAGCPLISYFVSERAQVYFSISISRQSIEIHLEVCS